MKPPEEETEKAKVLDSLTLHIIALGKQERLVLLALAERLLAGQRAYGYLDLENDKRDFSREGAEELADMLVYRALQEVGEKLGRANRDTDPITHDSLCGCAACRDGRV